MILRKKFGRRLRQIRQGRGLTQESLAEAIGMTVEFVSNMERGINGPSFGTLEKLSDVLETPVIAFFDFSGFKENEADDGTKRRGSSG